MANFGPSKTWTDGEILSHTDLNAALLDIINNVTNNNIDADNIDETDDYTWSGANSFTGGHSIKVLSNAASSIVTGTTLEWDPGDGGQMTDNSSGISLDFKLPDASDNQDVFASIAAICLDDAAGSEDGELSFRVATAGTNTEQMTLSSTALTVTPAITASGGVSGSVTSSNATITGGTITGITDIAVADGGTGASTAAAARTNLGLEIGVDVQAYDAELQALSGLTPTDGNIIVGNGSTFTTESGATARTSLGLGSIATQDASAVSISGGSLTGMTSYSGGTISGSTGTFSGVTTVGSAGATADFAVWTDGTSSTAAGFTVDASADEVIVGQLSGGGNTNFKVRNRLNNTVFQVTPDAPSTTVFAPNIATGSAGTLTVKTGSINSDSIRLEAGGTTSTWLESRGYLGHSWYVDSTRSMTLDSTGLGVGTSSPSYKTEIAAGASTEGLAVTASSGDVYLQTDGQVYGYQKLDVATAGLQIKGFSNGGGTKTETGRIQLTQDATGSAGGEFRLALNNGTSLVERLRVLKEGGITFNGDTAAANALDDYEEGTFSVGIAGSTTAGTVNVTSTAGYYTKIGNVVHAFGFVSWNSATGTGNLKLTGLPFTSSSSGQYYPAGSMTSANLTFSHTITPYVSLGSTFMQIQQSQSGAAGTFVQVDSTAEIYFNVTYFV